MRTYTEEPCEGKLSCTVLKTSTGSDPAAEFDSRYLWLNRVQCLGIGEVLMNERVYIYDLYAVR